MITPEEAEARILGALRVADAERLPLEQALGRVLRRSIVADRPFPPADRVMMDGFALQAEAVAAGRREFPVAGLAAAGAPPPAWPGPAGAVEVLTGAILPAGADAVVPQEETVREGDRVRLTPGVTVKSGQFIHRCGQDARAGAVLVPAGGRITPREIAVALGAGRFFVDVAVRPVCTVVSLGDELVDPPAPVAPYQIRPTNRWYLRSWLETEGAGPARIFHAGDDPAELAALLPLLLEPGQVILLTGGAGGGRRDTVFPALAAAGVTWLFRGVAQRPGKPFACGLTPAGCPLFALPGNPLSTMVCLARYVRPALCRLAGANPAPPLFASALLPPPALDPGWTRFAPARLSPAPDGRLLAHLLPFSNSGDFAATAGSDGTWSHAAPPHLAPSPSPGPRAQEVLGLFRPW